MARIRMKHGASGAMVSCDDVDRAKYEADGYEFVEELPDLAPPGSGDDQPAPAPPRVRMVHRASGARLTCTEGDVPRHEAAGYEVVERLDQAVEAAPASAGTASAPPQAAQDAPGAASAQGGASDQASAADDQGAAEKA